jgi:hypothetical protein
MPLPSIMEGVLVVQAERRTAMTVRAKEKYFIS